MQKQITTQLLCFFLFSSFSFAQSTDNNFMSNRIDTTATGTLILVEEVLLDAPLASVWDAYTTEEAWTKWATPLVEMDFKINGTIKTNYNIEGTIGDSTTNTLYVVNYVPHKLITMQADINKNWPEFMKKDQKDMYNVILFEALTPSRTKLTSYGMGYKNNEKYQELMKFFIKGNAWTYNKLREYLEQEPVEEAKHK